MKTQTENACVQVKQLNFLTTLCLYINTSISEADHILIKLIKADHLDLSHLDAT